MSFANKIALLHSTHDAVVCIPAQTHRYHACGRRHYRVRPDYCRLHIPPEMSSVCAVNKLSRPCFCPTPGATQWNENEVQNSIWRTLICRFCTLYGSREGAGMNTTCRNVAFSGLIAVFDYDYSISLYDRV